MPEHVISNTSPLFYLHRLRQLDLLQKLYSRLLVPPKQLLTSYRLDETKARIFLR